VGSLALVVCGSPFAARAAEVAGAIGAAGWAVRVVATRAAMTWVDDDAVEAVTGFRALVEQRRPDEPTRFPTPVHVVVCPATFNTVNKLAAGIADTYAHGVLCEAVATGVPLTVVPTVGPRLSGHPAYGRSVELLTAVGVRFVDPVTGEPGSVDGLVATVGVPS
jgi:phosphopantothenoylcysteine synthetase/decarboxylase